MTIQDWSENIVLVELHAEPKMGEQLEDVVRYVRDKGNCGVVIDFGNVTILTSSSLAVLLRLRKLVDDNGQRLLLSSVGSGTRGIISITGLDDVFEFADDRFDALATVRAMPDQSAASMEDTC